MRQVIRILLTQEQSDQLAPLFALVREAARSGYFNGKDQRGILCAQIFEASQQFDYCDDDPDYMRVGFLPTEKALAVVNTAQDFPIPSSAPSDGAK